MQSTSSSSSSSPLLSSTADLPASSFNLRKHLLQGHHNVDVEHARQEAGVRGLFRAGNSGLFVDGQVVGKCHRVAHARALGYEKPHGLDRKLMFQGGETNEDSWEKLLLAAGQKVLRGQKLRRAFEWGEVGGSPDIVITNDDGTWHTILELKQVSSLNSAIYRELEGDPDTDHLIQAATYSWLSGTPAILGYTSRCDFAVQFSKKKYGVDKVLPFYRFFYTEFRGGTLWWRDEYSSSWNKTLVTLSGIENYYRLLSKMETDRDLFSRPTCIKHDGAPMSWDRCGARYCPFSAICDAHELDYTTWVDAVRRECEVTA